jgi:hypothetical protein
MRILVLILLAMATLQAEDITTADGKVYKNAKILAHDARVVTISYDGGMATFPLANLPADALRKITDAEEVERAQAESKRREADARQKAIDDAPINYTDAVALLGQLGETQYNRFHDYCEFRLNKIQVAGDGDIEISIHSYSGGDHLSKEDKVTIFIVRSASDWLWLKYHDDVVLASGKERYTPEKIGFYSDVTDDGIMEIVNFDIPVTTLERMAAAGDFGIQVGVSQLSLTGGFSDGATDFGWLNKYLPREGVPVPTQEPHSAKYDRLIAKEQQRTTSDAPDSEQRAQPPSFNPGSIDDPIIGARP